MRFTRLPPAEVGDPDKFFPIEGRVSAANNGERIVLFAKSGLWWVQPLGNHPFTNIGPEQRWANNTHPGTAYAALLVAKDYNPPLTARVLPTEAQGVLAAAVAEGAALPGPPRRSLEFSGYKWEIRQTPYTPGGTRNFYDPKNAWVDGNGNLHLNVVKTDEGWTAAQVILANSLGYGTYRFVVRDISHFEPAMVLNLSIIDNTRNSREADIEFSRWGEPVSRNAQFVVQPYFVPENSVRFTAPRGVLTHFIEWSSDQVVFKTIEGDARDPNCACVASHAFTSGIPEPDNEQVVINLYVFGNRKSPLERGCEVVIEKFEFLP